MITPKDRYDYLAKNVWWSVQSAISALENARAEELQVCDKKLTSTLRRTLEEITQSMEKHREQWRKRKEK